MLKKVIVRNQSEGRIKKIDAVEISPANCPYKETHPIDVFFMVF